MRFRSGRTWRHPAPSGGSLAAVLVLVSGLLAGAAFAAPETDQGTELDDAEISLAVERELIISPGVEPDPIDVVTVDGLVTLSGTVDNLLARKRAANIASRVKGVRGVVNEIQVEPAPRADRELYHDVRDALRHNPATETWEIGVAVDDARVILSGAVDSWPERRLAERLAMGVRGVKAVESHIAVEDDTERSDEEIREDVEAALDWDARIDSALIEVRVDEGKVLLSGTVGSAYEKRLAAADALVSGAEEINADGLEVEWWARDEMVKDRRYNERGEEEIRKAVEEALLLDPRVISSDVKVRVTGGVAILTGVVDNLKAKRAAAQTAAHTTGVWRVKNHLKVRPAEARADEVIADALRANLALDPYLEAGEGIEVEVWGGVARLSGTVDTTFERREAGDVAAQVPGVVKVENQLRVEEAAPESRRAAGAHDWDPLHDDYEVDYARIMRKEDWEIRQDIERELQWSPYVEEDDVQVEVINAMATLTGSVAAWDARRQATKEALDGGAAVVDNELEVEGETPPGAIIP